MTNVVDTDPLNNGSTGTSQFLTPSDVQTFRLSSTQGETTTTAAASNYTSNYARSTLSLIDGNTAVKINAVASDETGEPYGLNISTSSRFQNSTGDKKLQYIEGNVTVEADTIIKGNLLVQDFVIDGNRQNDASNRSVGISATNLHTASATVSTVVDTLHTITALGRGYASRDSTYASKVDVDSYGVKIGNLMDASNSSNRLVLNHVYLSNGNELRIGDVIAYDAVAAGNQAYSGVDTCTDITAASALFTTGASNHSRVALNANQVDIVSDGSAPTSLAQTVLTETDSGDYVFSRVATLQTVVDNVSYLVDKPMSDTIKRRIGTLDSSIQSASLTALQETEDDFNDFVGSNTTEYFGVRDTAGVLKVLNLKVNAVGQGLTPEILNSIKDIAERLQGSNQYNMMSELALLQRTVGYLTSRLDSLTSEEFDMLDSARAAITLIMPVTKGFIIYRKPVAGRLSTSTDSYSAIAEDTYIKYTGYHLTVGGIRDLTNQVYYYNAQSGKGFFWDTTLSKWAYVEGVCLYTTAVGLLNKDDKDLFDDMVPRERYISTVLTDASDNTSLWGFTNANFKNYEDPYYGALVTGAVPIYSQSDNNVPALQTQLEVIALIENTRDALWTANADHRALFANQNLSASNATEIKVAVLPFSFGTLSDLQITTYFGRNFSSVPTIVPKLPTDIIAELLAALPVLTGTALATRDTLWTSFTTAVKLSFCGKNLLNLTGPDTKVPDADFGTMTAAEIAAGFGGTFLAITYTGIIADLNAALPVLSPAAFNRDTIWDGFSDEAKEQFYGLDLSESTGAQIIVAISLASFGILSESEVADRFCADFSSCSTLSAVVNALPVLATTLGVYDVDIASASAATAARASMWNGWDIFTWLSFCGRDLSGSSGTDISAAMPTGSFGSLSPAQVQHRFAANFSTVITSDILGNLFAALPVLTGAALVTRDTLWYSFQIAVRLMFCGLDLRSARTLVPSASFGTMSEAAVAAGFGANFSAILGVSSANTRAITTTEQIPFVQALLHADALILYTSSSPWYAAWTSFSSDMKLQFSDQNFSSSSGSAIRAAMSALGVSFGTLSNDNIEFGFRTDFRNCTADYAVETIISGFQEKSVTGGMNPAGDFKYSSAAGRKIYTQTNYTPPSGYLPIYGYSVTTTSDTVTFNYAREKSPDDIGSYIFVNTTTFNVFYVRINSSWYKITTTGLTGSSTIMAEYLFSVSKEESKVGVSSVTTFPRTFYCTSVAVTKTADDTTEYSMVDLLQESILLQYSCTLSFSA